MTTTTTNVESASIGEGPMGILERPRRWEHWRRVMGGFAFAPGDISVSVVGWRPL